jgi:hypothetical protein
MRTLLAGTNTTCRIRSHLTLGAATAALALIGGLSSPAHAVVCSGTTTPVSNGGTVTAAFLLATGNCVSAADKIFGEFSSSGNHWHRLRKFSFAAIQGTSL